MVALISCPVKWLIILHVSLQVVLWRREKSKPSMGVGETPSRFQFAESMKRTQEAVRKLSSCLCCGWLGDAGDKYAQDVINTELEMLKRTIRQVSASLAFTCTMNTHQRNSSLGIKDHIEKPHDCN